MQVEIKKTILVAILLSASYLSRSQSTAPDVIVSSGDFFSNANYSLAWSLGEVMSETYSSANNFLTQGFHQPDYGTLTFTENPDAGTGIIAFPNPVINDLHISFGDKKGIYLIRIIDALGNLLSAETVSVTIKSEKTISFRNYSSGMYLIQIINNSSFSKSSYTIIKVGM